MEFLLGHYCVIDGAAIEVRPSLRQCTCTHMNKITENSAIVEGVVPKNISKMQ